MPGAASDHVGRHRRDAVVQVRSGRRAVRAVRRPRPGWCRAAYRIGLGRSVFDAPGDDVSLGVEETATGRLVGDVVLFWHSEKDRSGEVGYIFHPGVRGRGYAGEAVAALLDLGFGGLGLHRIVARINELNEASVRVVERLGFRREARTVESIWFKGGWATMLEYALLEREWAPRSQIPPVR
ncbi:GNAT family N-acetyltransferase [Yimella sp. NH-Cas1]|nr:GNAT family protein [Yimella sp. RIT 621]MCG8656547.1 GNAT family N-acetyltransferase [Yimella sp. NH-Cas1]